MGLKGTLRKQQQQRNNNNMKGEDSSSKQLAKAERRKLARLRKKMVGKVVSRKSSRSSVASKGPVSFSTKASRASRSVMMTSLASNRAALGHSQASAVIARSYALPLESSPIRYSTVYSSRPTAVAHPKNIVSTNFTKAVLEAREYEDDWPADGENFAALCRNPLNFAIVYAPNPNGDEWRYYFRFGDTAVPTYAIGLQTSALEQPVARFIQGEGALGEIIWDVPVSSLLVSSVGQNYVPGGVNRYFAGKHDGKLGFWVDGNLTIGGQFSSIQFNLEFYNELGIPVAYATDSACEVLLLELQGGAWIEIQKKGIVGDSIATKASGHFQINRPNYYALQFVGVANTTLDSGDPIKVVHELTAYVKGFGANYVHHHVSGVEEKLTTVSNMCIHAGSLMLSSQAALMAANGRVIGVQIACGEQWFRYSGKDTVTKVARLDDLFQGEFKSGCYGFLKPCSPDDSKSVPLVTRSNTGRITGVCAPLLPESGWVIMACSVTPQALVGTSEAAFSYTTYCASLEYTTTDQWVDTRLPNSTITDFENGMVLLGKMQQFHENPFHLKDITNFLKGAGQKVLKWGPSVMRMLAPLAGEFAPLAGLASSGLEEVGRLANR